MAACMAARRCEHGGGMVMFRWERGRKHASIFPTSFPILRLNPNAYCERERRLDRRIHVDVHGGSTLGKWRCGSRSGTYDMIVAL